MTAKPTRHTGTETVFLGDAPGQGETVRIGKVTYKRGETYRDVPPEHMAKGGFYITSFIGGVVVVRGRSVKRGIVLGTAPSMWSDLEAARAILGSMQWDLIAVNGAGILYTDPITLWASVHGYQLVKWMRKREEQGLDMGFKAYGNFAKSEPSADVIRWNRPNGGGSSGLYATLTALELGYDQLILCGIPISGDTRHSYDTEELAVVKADCPYESYRSGWIKSHEELKDKVRSMSGWTAEKLGKPTHEWLLAAQHAVQGEIDEAVPV